MQWRKHVDENRTKFQPETDNPFVGIGTIVAVRIGVEMAKTSHETKRRVDDGIPRVANNGTEMVVEEATKRINKFKAYIVER